MFMKKSIYLFTASIFTIFIIIFIYAILLSLPVRCHHIDHYITIPKDSTVHSISRILNNNLCVNATLFKVVMKLTMNEKNIKSALISVFSKFFKFKSFRSTSIFKSLLSFFKIKFFSSIIS